jgi:hypothetical protein
MMIKGMNLEGFLRKRSWPNFKALTRHSPIETEKNHENPVRIVALWAEI